jgi:hypothetical protein
VAVSYLLPCRSCGEKIRVGRQQAGQLVRCSCGAPLEVPTFGGLARLETVESDPSAKKQAGPWGGRQRIRLVAGVILVAAFAIVGYLLCTWPVGPPQEGTPEHFALVKKRVDSLSPAESWQWWETFRAAGLDPRRPKPDLHYEEALRWYRGGLVLAMVLAVGGAASMVTARWIHPAASHPQDGDAVD